MIMKKSRSMINLFERIDINEDCFSTEAIHSDFLIIDRKKKNFFLDDLFFFILIGIFRIWF